MFDTWGRERVAPLALRLALGVVCLQHGFTKITADGGMAWAPSLGVGWQLAIAWGEFFAGLAILFGFRCRIAAGLVLLLTAGTWLWWHGYGLVQLPLATLESPFLLLFGAVSLLFLGAGELSVDARNSGGRSSAPRPARRKAG